MSINLNLGLSALEGIGIGLLQLLNTRNKRRIASIVAQITIEEHHEDELEITKHPVEQNAAISDHAYKQPARLTVRAGWSNTPSPQDTGLFDIPSNILSGLTSTLSAFNGPSAYVKEIYAQLLALQVARQPFDVLTGKRIYQSMLISSLATNTTEKTENALFIRIGMQQVVLVQTKTTAVPPTDVQKSPEVTAATIDRGNVQLQPRPLTAQDQ